MDQKIRIHADGEFSALKRQLRGLETDFKRFEGVVNRGANKGGFFSKEDTKALELYRQRYASMDKLVQQSISEQIQKLRELEKQSQKARGAELKRIQDEISARKKMMNDLRSTQGGVAERYQSLSGEASGYGQQKASSGGGGLGGMLLGGGKGLLGLALGALGIGGLFSGAMQAYQDAVAREKYVSDLGMRIGGSNPNFAGLRRGITNTGLRYGYNGLESMMAMDNVSSRMGTIGMGDLAGVQALTRAYGLDLSRQSDNMGRFGQLGAVKRGEMQQFADMIANAIETSGMQARAAEQIEATKSLVEQVAQDQPGSINTGSLLSLQTILNKTGLAGFQGERGAQALSQISSMFSSSDPSVSMFVDRSLGYGTSRNYYQTRLAKEKGLTDPENLSSVLGSVSRIGTGLSDSKRAELQDFALANMTGISLTEAKALRERTNGYSDLSAENVSAIADTFAKSGTVEQRVGIKDTSLGQQANKADANLEEAMANIGTNLIGPMNDLKNTAADLINDLNDLINKLDLSKDSFKGLAEAVGVVAATAAGAWALTKLMKLTGGGGGGGTGGLGGLGGAASKAEKEAGKAGKAAGEAGKAAKSTSKLGKLGKLGGKGLSAIALPLILGSMAYDAYANPDGFKDPKSAAESLFQYTDVGFLNSLMGGEHQDATVPDGFFDHSDDKQKMQQFMDELFGKSDGSTADPALTDSQFKSLQDAMKQFEDASDDTIQTNDESLKSQDDHQQTSENKQTSFYTDSKKLQNDHNTELLKISDRSFKEMSDSVKTGMEGLTAGIAAMYAAAGGSGGGGYSDAGASLGGVIRTSNKGYNPFSKYMITSSFGDTADRSSAHKGTDFGMPFGTSIPAMMSGQVDDVGYDGSRGNYIRVKTANGDMYTYMHMANSSSLQKGSIVLPGQALGQVGSTGDSTGPHLHLGYQRWNGSGYDYVDPMSILNGLPTSIGGSAPTAADTGAVITGRLQIDVNVNGLEGANSEQVKKIATDVFNQYNIQKLLTNPSKP